MSMKLNLSNLSFKSFTLIELLIVIVIIGILAVSLLPRLTGAQDRARVTSIKALLKQAYTQAQIYHMDNGGTYAGLCNDTTIQGILSSLGGSGYASCYVHPNTITTIDWGVATTYKDRHYLTGPQGVMVLDSTNLPGGNRSWNDAMSACELHGKTLANLSSLRALWQIQSTIPYSMVTQNRSSTENPNDGTRAYRARMDSGGIVSEDKGLTRSVHCTSLS